jgi:hypothetical protein
MPSRRRKNSREWKVESRESALGGRQSDETSATKEAQSGSVAPLSGCEMPDGQSTMPIEKSKGNSQKPKPSKLTSHPSVESGSAALTCGKPLAFRSVLDSSSSCSAPAGRLSLPAGAEQGFQGAGGPERHSLSASQAAEPQDVANCRAEGPPALEDQEAGGPERHSLSASQAAEPQDVGGCRAEGPSALEDQEAGGPERHSLSASQAAEPQDVAGGIGCNAEEVLRDSQPTERHSLSASQAAEPQDVGGCRAEGPSALEDQEAGGPETQSFSAQQAAEPRTGWSRAEPPAGPSGVGGRKNPSEIPPLRSAQGPNDIGGAAQAEERARPRLLAAMKVVVPKAPWSAVAQLPPCRLESKAAARLPHSKALRAFSSKVVSARSMESAVGTTAGGELPDLSLKP